MRCRIFSSSAQLVVIAWATASPAGSLLCGQEFRIETEVYTDVEEGPISRATTLFEKSAVYHFTEHPAQIAIYRHVPGESDSQFTLLDLDKKRRTDLSVDRMEKLIDKLTQWSAKQEGPLVKFSAEPDFKESYDESTGRLTLANPTWSYETATIKVESPELLLRYREFTDRYAELNALLTNSPPPGPRLALNAALVRHGVAPVEIRRIIHGKEAQEVRAVHLFAWRLSRDDRERLDDAREKIASYPKVTNSEFRGE